MCDEHDITMLHISFVLQLCSPYKPSCLQLLVLQVAPSLLPKLACPFAQWCCQTSRMLPTRCQVAWALHPHTLHSIHRHTLSHTCTHMKHRGHVITHTVHWNMKHIEECITHTHCHTHTRIHETYIRDHTHNQCDDVDIDMLEPPCCVAHEQIKPFLQQRVALQTMQCARQHNAQWCATLSAMAAWTARVFMW